MSKEKLMQQLEGLEKTNFNKDCLKDALELIADEAKRIVPVRTGKLRDSIYVEMTDKSGYVKADAEYAGIVEYGTDSREAHPYLRPAFETKSDKALKIIATSVEDKIKEVVNK